MNESTYLPRFTNCLIASCLLVGLLMMSGCGRDLPTTGESDTATLPAAEAAEVEAVPAVVTSDAELPVETGEPGFTREQTFIASMTIFVLAVFVGFELITKVPPTLHTPLMSGSNAISGITIVGAVLMAANNNSKWAMFFGLLAVIMASVNVVGGFMVTDRMLAMFKKK